MSRQSTASSTTHYINRFYAIEYAPNSTTTATTTSYIWQGDTLVAYVETPVVGGVAGTPVTYFVHPDHLGSTNVVTNANGTTVQVLDYYPYGGQRISEGSASSDRQYIGERFDGASGLSYLNARYYDGGRGQFVSQDPVFGAIGNNGQVRDMAGRTQSDILRDPQLLNSYGYSRGNPIGYKDPEGELGFVPALLYVFGTYGAINTGVDLLNGATVFGYYDQFSDADRAEVIANLALDRLFGGAGDVIKEPAKRAGFQVITASLDVADEFFADEVYDQVDLDERFMSDTIESFAPSLLNTNGSTRFDSYRLQIQQAGRNTSMPQSNGSASQNTILGQIQGTLRSISAFLSTLGGSLESNLKQQ